jgi:UDP-N-acetylglucosamine acyltransferase
MGTAGGTRVHPTAGVGPGVGLGADVVVGPHVVLLGPLELGDRCWVGPHTVVGAPAEIRGIDHGAAWDGQVVGTGVTVGADTVLREHVTVHQGHYDVTTVGAGCYLMNRAYVAHDDRVGDGVTMASAATLAGHVHVGRGAYLGMGAVVHQRVVVGPGAIVGMGAVVTRPVPPWAKAFGNPCRVRGANTVGLERAGGAPEAVAGLAEVYAAGGPGAAAWAAGEEPPAGLVDDAAWWRGRVGPKPEG